MSLHDILVARYKPMLKKLLMSFRSGLKFKQLRDVIYLGTRDDLNDIELKVGLIFEHSNHTAELVMVLSWDERLYQRGQQRYRRGLDELQSELASITKSHNGKIGPVLWVQGNEERKSQQFTISLPVSKFNAPV